MRLEQMYQDVILDHYKHPHGRGLRDPFDAEVHHVNPTCGDEVTLRVHVVDDVVVDVSHDSQGCSISQAATSVLSDQVVGVAVPRALEIVDAFSAMIGGRGTVEPDEDAIGDGIAFAGVARYPARVKCALLGWMAFKDAVVRSVDGTTTAQTRTAGTATPGTTTAGTTDGTRGPDYEADAANQLHRTPIGHTGSETAREANP